MKRYLTLVLLALLISIPAARGQQVERATLKGLKKLHVLIENLDSESQSTGLFREQLKTDVELRLRRSRVPVGDSIFSPYVYVNVNTLQLSTGSEWAYSIHVGLNQEVTLDRDKSISCTAETWNRGSIGVAPNREFVSTVREKVGDLVDQFINDYLAENP